MNWKRVAFGLGVPLAIACGGSAETTAMDTVSMEMSDASGRLASDANVGATAAAGSGASAPSMTTTTAAAASGAATASTLPGMAAASSPSGAAAAPSTGPTVGGASTNASASPTSACASCTIPPECQGFPLDGLQYSPGGDVLPNKCEPFHATLNNPYAVRCIDAMPNYKTDFPGDEYCILPPPPDKGIQVGFHPHGKTAEYWEAMWAGDMSGYNTSHEDWVLPPGDERTQNYRTRDAPNETEMNYYRTYFRMRTGSHHMIITLHESSDEDGWIPAVGEALPGFLDGNSGATTGILGGEQRPDDNTPFSLNKPPEDEGLYLTLPPKPAIIFNVHHFNAQDKPLLRESWNNIWWEQDARTRVSWYMGLDFTQVATLNVSPGQVADLHYSWNVGNDVRLVRMFGHRHFWTTNLTSWIERAGGGNDVIYQSFDWYDMPTFRYDSQTMNPPVNTEGRTDGAASGIVMLQAGDKLHFNCHIEFTNERQATDENAPSPMQIGSLRFANEAYNGEMCINFGNVTGGGLGLPGVETSAVPDFAKVNRDDPQ